ncbi:MULTISPECIES: helix-turn-helix transcriptional regulator [unclassified Nonomuraea]|uniref:helix-turn-helix domain-containing protein n=1 Tax=unclassified Nonomuraea TaxID=2593643 RepID=UPI0033F4F30A
MEDSGQALSGRLRALRTRRWPHSRISQERLARALGVSAPLISSFESTSHPKAPKPAWLDAYATLFCTERSVEGGGLRLLSPDELTAEELRERDQLRQELLELRAAALGEPAATRRRAAANLWEFGDDNQITLVCARLPPEMLARMPYVEPGDPDFIELYTYADLDALFELHGHIRAVNPRSEVRRRTPQDLEPDDLTAHLVLLGGIDWNEITTDVLHRLELPIEQVTDWDKGVEPFFLAGGERHRPRLDGGTLKEDVALFYRGPNPLNRKRTLTICNGMYGRGTLGAVRTLTDSRFRDRNSTFARERFGGRAAFAILTRVAVLNGLVLTPDWTQGEARLFEWPE